MGPEARAFGLFFASGEESISAVPPHNHPTFALLLPCIHPLSESGFVFRENRGAKQFTSEILKLTVDSPEAGTFAKWPKIAVATSLRRDL